MEYSNLAIIAAFAFSYPLAMLCLLIDVLVIRFHFGLEVVFTPEMIVTAAVVSPLVSLGVLALMSFLFWTVRHANMLAAFLPVILSLGLWAYVSAHPTTGVLLYLVALALGGAALVIAVCTWIVSRLSRQFVVGL